MLCGFLPFEHDSISELYKLVQTCNYDEPDHLSKNSRDFLKRIMQVDPSKRPSIAQMRKHPFCRAYCQPIIKGLLPSETIYV
jgi:5'-AMP-activated protein kinase catalytic alpha subunit